MIANEAYEAEWHNPDNRRVMLSVLSLFPKRIDKDQAIECMQIGLLRAMKTYEKDKGRKFTTWLYGYVYWECQRACRRNGKTITEISLDEVPEIEAPVSEHRDEMEYLKECMTFLPRKERSIIHQYYFSNMTFREIGEANGYTPQAAQNNLAKATSRLRRICNQP